MDVLEVVAVAVIVLASLPIGGPLVALPAMAVLDLPPGSHDVAADFISGGGWAVLLATGLIALIAAFYAGRGREPSAPLPGNGSVRE